MTGRLRGAYAARPVLFAALVAAILVLTPGTAHAILPALLIAGAVAGGLFVANDLVCWFVYDCGTGTASLAVAKDCYFCVIPITLACQGGGFSRAIFLMFAPMALSVARFLFLCFLAMQVGKIFVFPKDGGENLKEIVKQAGFFTLAISIMTASSAGGGNPWLFDWGFDLMQRLTLAVSMKAIDYMAMQGIGQVVRATVPNFAGGCPGFVAGGATGAVSAGLAFATDVAQMYADLWAHVELGVYPIIAIAMQRLTPDHFTAAGAVSGIILAAPYVFVMGVFGAFMVQTMFYFVAIAAAMPFLISGIMFQTTRGWLLSAFRFLVGGCMTIFFCAVAMGFTLSLIVINVAITMKDVGAGQVGVVEGLNKSPLGYAARGIIDALTGNFSSGSVSGQSAPVAANVVSLTLSSMDNSAYWQLFLTGFISIMLHLAAPRIASNISGANDSATTAAAVTGAGQLAASKLLGAPMRGGAMAVGGAGQVAGGILGWTQQRAADLLAGFRGAGKP